MRKGQLGPQGSKSWPILRPGEDILSQLPPEAHYQETCQRFGEGALCAVTESTWGAWSPDHGAVGTETKTPALRIPWENLKSEAEGAEVGALGFLWERQGQQDRAEGPPSWQSAGGQF